MHERQWYVDMNVPGSTRMHSTGVRFTAEHNFVHCKTGLGLTGLGLTWPVLPDLCTSLACMSILACLWFVCLCAFACMSARAKHWCLHTLKWIFTHRDLSDSSCRRWSCAAIISHRVPAAWCQHRTSDLRIAAAHGAVAGLFRVGADGAEQLVQRSKAS